MVLLTTTNLIYSRVMLPHRSEEALAQSSRADKYRSIVWSPAGLHTLHRSQTPANTDDGKLRVMDYDYARSCRSMRAPLERAQVRRLSL